MVISVLIMKECYISRKKRWDCRSSSKVRDNHLLFKFQIAMPKASVAKILPLSTGSPASLDVAVGRLVVSSGRKVQSLMVAIVGKHYSLECVLRSPCS